MTKINVTQSSMPAFDEYIEEIRSIWDNVWLTNMGPKHNQLEKQLQRKPTQTINMTEYMQYGTALDLTVADTNKQKLIL